MSSDATNDYDAEADDVVLPVKRTTGETMEERLTGNAYHNILPARYLKKDADGNFVEEQEDLFRRVGRNVALAEAVFEAEKRDVEITVTPDLLKPDHPRRDELAAEVFGAGTTVGDDAETTLTAENVNKFAYETLVPELPDEIREHVEAKADEFRRAMEQLSFIPNSPTLMNAGDELQQLSACFVMSPDDDLTDIHETAKNAAEVFQSGGGCGYAFWQLRPFGDPVGSTGGIASGPITFMETYDQLCETIAQGGARRGAQMGVMRVSHPDVIEFLHAKNKDVSLAHTLRLNDPDDYTHTEFSEALAEARELIDGDGKVPKHLRNAVEGHLSNFNISVGITDDFMEALEAGEEFTFTNPRTGEPHIATEETKEMYGRYGLGDHVEPGEELSIDPQLIWDRIVEGAHENGEPGVIYLERVNKQHSFDIEEHPDHRILATNPCGEQPLEEYEACNLGHINLSTLAAEDSPDWRVFQQDRPDNEPLEESIAAFLETAIDWEEFDRRIELGTRFLENVVTMSDFPVPEIEEKVREMRKIGLGIMGLAQLYIQLGIRYGSDAGNEVARQVMTHINHGSKAASHDLAKERGSFDEWEKSKYADPTEYADWFEHQTGEDAVDWADGYPIRNHNTTTIAPTGCVEEDSLVSTDEGLRPIKDLDDTTAEFEQWSEIEVGVSTDGGTKTATATYDNGFADVRRIETEGGFSVASTPDHRFRTITEAGEYAWKEADEFEPGDRIVMQRNTFEGGERLRLDTTEAEKYHHNTDEELRLPERMTPELAEFLGYFMGDGYVHDGVGVKLVVDSEATELDEHLRELGESLFGVAPTVEDKETRHLLSFGGRHLPRYFEANGWEKDSGNEGEGAASAFVPEAVLRGDEAVAEAFLRGLFEADGTASRKVELSTVSSTLADQVQTLLLSLGIVFVRDTLETADMDDHYGDRPRHSVRGANRREDKRFLDEVGFITKTTDFELTAQSYKNDTYPPAVVETLREVDGYDSVSKPVRKRVNQSPINGAVSRKLVRDIESETGQTVEIDGRRLTDIYAATVTSVTEEKAYTKDISVPSNNTYVANGFVTHNTTSMVGNTTGGCEPIYNVAYYKNVSDDVQGDEMLVEFDDYFLRTLEANDIDVDAVKEEAKEQMAENAFDGVEGLETVPDAIGELFVVTSDLSGKEHAGVQCACQEGVDSAISKCIEEGTLVQTDQGLVAIEEFSDNDEPGTFSEVDGEYTIDGYDVTSHYYAGEKPSTRIRLDSGAELVGATESHRVLTPDGWELLADLEPGDTVLGEFSVSHGGGGEPIDWEDDLRTSSNPIETPDRMTPEFAEFLGMVAADGGAYEETGRVEITTENMPVEDRYADLCDQLFGAQAKVDTDDRTASVRRVYVTSRNLARCVRSLIGEGAYAKHVPRQVIHGNAEEKLAFVRGLTLDGYNASNGFTVYEGMAEELAYQTAQLLRSFGVPKVYEGRKWVSESEAYAHQVTVSNELQELVGAIEPHKNPDPQSVRYKVPVDTDNLSLEEFETGTSAYYAARSARNRGNPYLLNETAEKLGIEHSGIAYEVTEVEDVGTRELYDIEVEESHRYLVNGMTSHNTCNFPNSATPEDMDEVYRYIYENGGKGVTVYRDGTRSKQVLTTRAENTEFSDMDESEAAAAILDQIDEAFGGLESFLESDALLEQVETDLAELLGDAEETGELQPRPDTLHGVSQRVKTGYGKLYVTINEDPETGQPFEVFANIGHSGGYTNSFTEALGKVISTALRAGVDPEEVVDELRGTRSPKVAWDKGEQINSIPDAIGTALHRYIEDEIDKPYPKQTSLDEAVEADASTSSPTTTEEPEPPTPEPETDGGGTEAATGVEAAGGGGARAADQGDTQSLIEAGESPECPDCGGMSLYFSEGCKTCESCGWSEC